MTVSLNSRMSKSNVRGPQRCSLRSRPCSSSIACVRSRSDSGLIQFPAQRRHSGNPADPVGRVDDYGKTRSSERRGFVESHPAQPVQRVPVAKAGQGCCPAPDTLEPSGLIPACRSRFTRPARAGAAVWRRAIIQRFQHVLLAWRRSNLEFPHH